MGLYGYLYEYMYVYSTGALRGLYPQTNENLRNTKTIFWN